MLKSEAAAYLAGVTQTEGAEASAPTNLHVITGEVGESSEDGKTLVKIDGLMFSESDDQYIEVDALGGLEEGDIATIVLTGEQGHAMTPLAIGSIGSVDRITVRIAAIEADYIKVEQLDAAEARIGDLEADHVSVDDLSAATARIGTLETTRATITDLEAAKARIGELEVDHVTVDNFEAAKARIGELESDHVSTDDLEAATGRIGQLEADTADIDTIRANSAKVQNLTAAELEADHAAIEALDSNYAHITNGVIDNAKIGYADVDNLSAHYAEIQNGKINSALIDTAAIVDEQVFTVTGNKATIEEINADKITVRNLNAKNLTVETADGYVTIGDKKTPTKEYLESLKDELQQEIDGAVETFTSSAVPLLSNYPASDWIISGATEEEQRKAYAKHVGDICYVQNSALDQNGYAYRFAYDSTEQTFKWVLIKDSDVTKALGDISDLKTFESNTTTWMEETDEGLTTIRQNHTALSGVVDKTVVETKQLWYTKANTTAPTKPNSTTFPNGVTSTSTAGNAWRVVVPAYNASYPNYYYCLQYKLADGTYAWSDVVRDIAMGESQQQGRKGVADAATAQSTADSATTAAATADGKAVAAQSTANANIKSSVQLWFTKANTTAPNKPTAQVTMNDATKTNQWNLAIPTYSASYPNYFYCYQQQKGDGTWQWTDVVYDRSITEAQAKAQSALPSSEFNTFKTTTFKEVVDEVGEQSSTITSMSERISTTARNLLTGTVSPQPGGVRGSRGTGEDFRNESKWYTYHTESTLTRTDDGIRIDHAGGASGGIVIPLIADGILSNGEKLTLSFDYRGNYDAFGTLYVLCNPTPNISQGTTVTLDASGEWAHYEYSWAYKANANVPWAILIEYYNSAGKWLEIRDGSMMLERGAMTVTTLSNTVNTVKQTADTNKASITSLTQTVNNKADGTTVTALTNRVSTAEQNLDGITTRVGKTESELDTVSNPNLSPFFSFALDNYYNVSSNPDGYWDANKASYGTNLSDGWAHLSKNNTGSSSTWFTLYEHSAWRHAHGDLKGSTKYTVMIEFRNVTKSGNVTCIGTSTHASSWPSMFVGNSDKGNVAVADGVQYHIGTTVADPSSVTGNTCTTRTLITIPAGASIDCDVRVSLYEGEYSGPYKPYVDQTLSNRVKSAETAIEQNAEDITLRATKTEAYQVAQPNLSPYYSGVPYASTNAYWKSIQLGNGFTFTSMGDGWMRVQCTNSGSSVIRRDWYPIKCPSVRAGQPYTWLAEVRNNASSSASSNSDFYLVQTNNLQFWGQKAIKTIEGPSGSGMSVNIGTCGSTYTLRKVQNAETSSDGHWTGGDEANVVGLACWTFRCAANSSIDYEVRLSLYEGEYTGPYKPYSGTQLYASQAELKVQADRIGMVVSNSDASSSLALTAGAMEYIGDHVEIKGTDGTSTVISGGKIQANSIGADEINATSINASNRLTVGAFNTSTQNDILNSNVQVGGRNLLLRTAALSDTTYWFRSSITSVTENQTDECGGSDAVLVTPSATSWYLASSNDNTRVDDIGGQYVASVWMRADTETTVQLCCRFLKNDTDTYSGNAVRKNVTVTTEWQQFTVAGSMIGNQTSNSNCVWIGQSTSVPVYVSHFKFERGNKATDWTRAQEDTTASVDQTYIQNLTPYFQMDMTQTSDEYWANLTYERFSRLDDGWAHFEYTNSGTKTANNFIKLKLLDFLEPGGKYTLLAEFKNVSISADGGSFYSQQGNDVQVWGDSSYCGFGIPNATIRALSGGAGTFYRTLTLLTADSKDPSGTVRGSLPKTSFMSINQQVQAGQTVSYDLRLSLYAAGYTGVYKPYVGSQLYATGKSLSDSQDFLDERIDGLDERTTNAENSLETASSDIDKVSGQLEQLNTKYASDKAQRDQWLDFTRSEGLVIGDNESAFKTVIGSESMEFKNGDVTLAKASGTEFIADVMRSEELHIGKWMWTKRNEGNNLSLKWVGN